MGLFDSIKNVGTSIVSTGLGLVDDVLDAPESIAQAVATGAEDVKSFAQENRYNIYAALAVGGGPFTSSLAPGFIAKDQMNKEQARYAKQLKRDEAAANAQAAADKRAAAARQRAALRGALGERNPTLNMNRNRNQTSGLSGLRIPLGGLGAGGRSGGLNI